MVFQAPRAEVVLVLSRSRSVTPADRSYDLIDAATYNFINSSRPPKILESPLDSKSLSAGMTREGESDVSVTCPMFRSEVCRRAPRSPHHSHAQEGGSWPRLQSGGWQGLSLWRQTHDDQENIYW